ncbi:uroporphyrinogen-III synthase [Parashewanella spongiae]|uniref:Uroporphyrinogen-III synthase n=1 Tax=Parashewanella spongiae TaxID=342950 RepID=A0A3A6TS16_9GAMM|nr:uroporphyrinogen-III synthase [Parashewanella spongiae]MCL1079469.1 uroporphyrinogen-III synthase [Parashewanella spongiae]RJY11343.1 uroporphyrinogen-III synthase [Parashewanella spongiae]
MHILLTRAKGSNQVMSEVLTQRGIAHSVTPLLEVQSYCVDIEQKQALNEADIVIFISVNAVIYAEHSGLIPLNQTAQCFAVGSATHHELRKLGIDPQVAVSGQHHSEGLLELDALKLVNNKKITIVRGCGGREWLADVLRNRGAKVEYCEVYQRKMPDYTGQKICQVWQESKVSAILITSGEILSNLIKLVPKESVAWLMSCFIVVPSERVAELAKRAGLSNVINAGSASSEEMLAAVLDITHD